MLVRSLRDRKARKWRKGGGIPQRWSIHQGQWINHLLLVYFLTKNYWSKAITTKFTEGNCYS